MAARIRILDAALADQIAAGEVVERPASVVKELLENAIDAGATRISVAIADGGQSLVRVTDDGSGMGREDALLSIQRHATSKLASREELFAIRTLGFRGEALPSIASVSRFSLSTRLQTESAGTRMRVDGGAPSQAEPCGCAPGTNVEVRDLFYNVPARLKFLKSKATESAHVGTVCLRAALAHPEIAFDLQRDGRGAQDFVRARSQEERVRAAFPDEQLIAYQGSFDGAQLCALLGAPEKARSGAVHLHLFVNRRPVRDTALARAVAYAYGSVLPPGRFPYGALYLELDPSEVDVNVHPQKQEVRFARGRSLLDGLTRFLAKKLGTSAWSGPAARGASYWDQRLGAARPALPGAASSYTEQPGATAADPWDLSGPSALSAAVGGGGLAAFDRVSEAMGVATHDPATPILNGLGRAGFFGSLRPLGQSRAMFLICEGTTGIHILDQHAADERVRFDRLQRAHRSRDVKTQRLLFPERVECSELEALAIEEHQSELTQAGLECTRIGPTTVAVATVPALLHRAAPARLLRDVLTELGRTGERAFADAIDMALATMACHGSIRAGDTLSAEEIVALLRSLDDVQDFQGHCPHGRPIVCSLSFDELERRLGR